MKQLGLLLCSLMIAGTLHAQPVQRRVVAEHFTNSFCSVCANRNPALYLNLAQFPQVLHLAIYPSAPYAACTINQYNKPEQDARTNYYNVYGGTPRLIVQGVEYSGNFNDPNIFQSQISATSSFDARISLNAITTTMGEARLAIFKKDVSAIDSLLLYAVLAQDTLNFTSNNGEAHHYDVFRKSIWGSSSVKVAMPSNVGDSVVYTKTFTIDANWTSNHIYATAILQQQNKTIEQAARSNALQIAGNPTSVTSTIKNEAIASYPNPVSDRLFLTRATSGTAQIFDVQGRILLTQKLSPGQPILVDELAAGYYILQLKLPTETSISHFVKR